MVKASFTYAHHHGHKTTAAAVQQFLIKLASGLAVLQEEAKVTLQRRVQQIKLGGKTKEGIPQGRTPEELLPSIRHIPRLMMLMYERAEQAVFGLFSTMKIDASKEHAEFVTHAMNHARSSVTNNASR